jgi:hypothetical protein
MGTSDWLKHVRRRFKLSLNKPRMEKSIADLRALNTDFGLITEQIVRTLQEMLTDQKQQPTLRKSAGYLNTLQKYYRIRFASKALYSTLQLRWDCPSHTCHVFDMRIDGDTCNGKGHISHVTCKLAITHGDLPFKAEKALRLEVEQACEENGSAPEGAGQYSNKNDGAVHQLTKVLESSADRSTATSSRESPKTTESIRIGGMRGLMRRLRRTPDVQDLNRSFANVRLDDSPGMTAAPRLARDLELVDDFCEAFHGLSINCIGRSPLGVLRDPYSQWFYLSTPQTAPSSSQSFAEVIAWVAEEPVSRTLPRSVLVKLAGNLAEGIMQFYSTPWLSCPDLSQVIRIYNNSDPSVSSVQLEGPYFTTRLETRAKGKGKATDQIHGGAYGKASVADFSGARNELLFNFGIILLEIGFAQPWHMLKRSVSRTVTGEQLSDYKTAEKLAQLLINQMGLAYPKIIKKCLGCDFGLGETDMDNEDLQRKFLEDVVSELQRLREHIREMGLYLLG